MSNHHSPGRQTLAGRKVIWTVLTDSFDGKTCFQKTVSGHIVDWYWTAQGQCFTALVSDDGLFYVKPITEIKTPLPSTKNLYEDLKKTYLPKPETVNKFKITPT